MRSIFRRNMILALILFLGIAFIGCGDNTTETTEPVEENTIAGEYEIDITNLGMPLQFYLRIDEEDNFYLSNDRTFAVDKGHGTVGNSGETYMLIYSDSTNEVPKTSTFTVEEENLHFSTTLPYGSSNIPASKEDEENPGVFYYLVGKTLVYEEYFGEYAGGHQVAAMGSTIDYEYYLQLDAGREFYFCSEYELGGEAYSYVEEGYYDIVGSQVVLHYTEEDITGTYDSESGIQIAVKASEMGERAERTLQVAVTAECAGEYYGYSYFGMGGTVMYDAETVLVLDKFGGYVFTSYDTVSGTATESGTFTVDGTALTFTPDESSESYTGTLSNYTLEASFLVSPAAQNRTDMVLYNETVNGTFQAVGEDESENEYTATLTLNSDGTFELVVVDDESTTVYECTGTFAVTKTMFMQLTLTLEDTSTIVCVLSEVGININVDVESEVTVGFILEKE